jgi:hypothetical protein
VRLNHPEKRKRLGGEGRRAADCGWRERNKDLMPSLDYETVKRFDSQLGTSVLAVLLLVAVIGGFMWLEL